MGRSNATTATRSSSPPINCENISGSTPARRLWNAISVGKGSSGTATFQNTRRSTNQTGRSNHRRNSSAIAERCSRPSETLTGTRRGNMTSSQRNAHSASKFSSTALHWRGTYDRSTRAASCRRARNQVSTPDVQFAVKSSTRRQSISTSGEIQIQSTREGLETFISRVKHHGQKPYSCDICKKQFVAKCNLVNHMWQHKNQRQRPFKCTQCKKVTLATPIWIFLLSSLNEEMRPQFIFFNFSTETGSNLLSWFSIYPGK